MSEAHISVDLRNPGQVFACLGFLEAAEVLLGDAEGGFDWTAGEARFFLCARGDENPFAVVLRFLAEAEIRRRAPVGFDELDPEAGDVDRSETFVAAQGDPLTLPIQLSGGVAGIERIVSVAYWADASRPTDLKMYAGTQVGANIATAVLRGIRGKPGKRQKVGALQVRGLDALWTDGPDKLTAAPFDVLIPMERRFYFDPRGVWTAMDAGYSPDQQGHPIAASPAVEILAAVALEHARPFEVGVRQVRYAVWAGRLPPPLARAALALPQIAASARSFAFTLGLSGKNKFVTFAEEESES